jgi:hypothetical protein
MPRSPSMVVRGATDGADVFASAIVSGIRYLRLESLADGGGVSHAGASPAVEFGLNASPNISLSRINRKI